MDEKAASCKSVTVHFHKGESRNFDAELGGNIIVSVIPGGQFLVILERLKAGDKETIFPSADIREVEKWK